MNTLKSMVIAATVCLAAGGLAGTASAADDALLKKGKKVFNKCKVCHSIKKEKNKLGPHLVTVMGRKSGTLESYKKFSGAMKSAELVWDEENLDKYLTKPKALIPKGKMVFVGLKKEKDRKAVIAYIISMQKKGE